MSDMPERIWAHWEGWLGPDEPQKEIDFCQAEKYIRADIHAAEVERLREALDSLLLRCVVYRKRYEHFGGHDMRTGRAWDSMRRAMDEASEAIAATEQEPTND